MKVQKKAKDVALNDKVILPNGELFHVTLIEYDDNSCRFASFGNQLGRVVELHAFFNKNDIVNIILGN